MSSLVIKSFFDQPLIEARLRMTMGTSFLYLGDAKTAIEQFQAARELYTEHRGSNDPDTLSSMNNLALSAPPAARSRRSTLTKKRSSSRKPTSATTTATAAHPGR